MVTEHERHSPTSMRAHIRKVIREISKDLGSMDSIHVHVYSYYGTPLHARLCSNVLTNAPLDSRYRSILHGHDWRRTLQQR